MCNRGVLLSVLGDAQGFATNSPNIEVAPSVEHLVGPMAVAVDRVGLFARDWNQSSFLVTFHHQ